MPQVTRSKERNNSPYKEAYEPWSPRADSVSLEHCPITSQETLLRGLQTRPGLTGGEQESGGCTPHRD